MDSDGHFQQIKAQIPQAELHNYATTLRSITGGRGFHAETHSHYANLPKDIEKKVIAEYNRQREEQIKVHSWFLQNNLDRITHSLIYNLHRWVQKYID